MPYVCVWADRGAGNGCTNFVLMTRSYYDIQCELRREFDLPPVQTIAECVGMKQRVRRAAFICVSLLICLVVSGPAVRKGGTDVVR